MRRAAVFTAVLLGALGTSCPVAAAAAHGRVTPTSAVTATKWGAVLAPTTVTTVPSCPSSQYCTSYGFTLPSGSTGAYFNAWNTGSIALTGLSYNPTWSGGGSLTLAACSVAWVTSSGTCSGTTTTIFTNLSSGTTSAASALGTYPGAVGTEIYLHVTPGSSRPPSNTNVSVTTGVCSGGTACSDGTTSRQIRASTTTNA